MAMQLSDNDLEGVVGGSVNLSEAKNKIGFDTIGEVYTLKCPYQDARDLVVSLFVANPDLKEMDFDILVRDEFANRKWI